MKLDRKKPIAILGDVRSNVTALDAVLTDIKAKGIDQGVILGDLLSYGPDPVEVVNRVYDIRNHFISIIGFPSNQIFGSPPQHLNPRVIRAMTWLKSTLKPKWYSSRQVKEKWKWLQSLSSNYTIQDLQFASNTLVYPGDGCFPMSAPNCKCNAKEEFALINKILFYGIIGQASFVHSNDMIWNIKKEFPATHQLPEQDKIAIGPGSVGQPRDGDPRACYTVLDNNEVTWHRVEYDFNSVANRINAITELDNSYAVRLGCGR